MDGLQASILNIKLKYLTNWTLDRRKIAEYYKNNLDNKKFTLSEEKPYNFHVYHIFSIFCNNAKKLQKYLNENGIGTNFHYPIPAHLQKPYLKLGYYKTDLPVTEKLSKNQLSIPIYPEMKLSEVKYVLKILNNY
jgi:dTDP-4-amino-4,6-dideoxygalactose transaminase